MEGVFGDGRAPAVRRSAAGRRSDERGLSHIRHFAQGGYKIFERYKEHGLEALTDRARRPVRYANQLPRQIESLIVAAKRDKPHWGARKIRELLVRRLDGDCGDRGAGDAVGCAAAAGAFRRLTDALLGQPIAPLTYQRFETARQSGPFD